MTGKLPTLEKLYFAEFQVIDGINQHKDGLTFEQWREQVETELKDELKNYL